MIIPEKEKTCIFFSFSNHLKKIKVTFYPFYWKGGKRRGHRMSALGTESTNMLVTIFRFPQSTL